MQDSLPTVFHYYVMPNSAVKVPRADLDTPRPSDDIGIDAKIRRLEQYTRSLSSLLDTAARELKEARHLRDLRRNSASLSHQIPEELLAEIFMLAVAPYSTSHQRWKASTIIASVSHQWRNVALRAPRLWGRIVAHFNKFDAKLRCQLDRSRAGPLHSELHIPDVTSLSPATIRTWINMLESPLKRAISLVIYARRPAMTMLCPFPASMPDLQLFSWDALERVPIDQTEVPVQVVRLLDPALATPKAVRVRTGGFENVDPLEWDDRSLRRLEELRLEGWANFPDNDTNALIGKCSSLKSLTWIAQGYRSRNHPIETAILKSSTIEILHLYVCLVIPLTQNIDAAFAAFRRMELPMLKHLSMGGPACMDRVLSTQTQLRFPVLETLWFYEMFEASCILSFLNTHPTLQTFGCTHSCNAIRLLELLSQPASMVPWEINAPHLRALHITYTSNAPPGTAGPRRSTDFDKDLIKALRAFFTVRSSVLDTNFKVYLGDAEWCDDAKTPVEYRQFAGEFPQNIVLIGDNVPLACFQHNSSTLV